MVVVIIDKDTIRYPLLRSIFSPGHFYMIMSFFVYTQRQIDIFCVSFHKNMSKFLKTSLGIQNLIITMDCSLSQLAIGTQSQADYHLLEQTISKYKLVSPYNSLFIVFSTIQFISSNKDIYSLKNIHPDDWDNLFNICYKWITESATIQKEATLLLCKLDSLGFTDNICITSFINTLPLLDLQFTFLNNTFEECAKALKSGGYVTDKQLGQLLTNKESILGILKSIEQNFQDKANERYTNQFF
jgi:hypothetical protein